MEEKEKKRISGPALFMDIIIGLCVFLAAVCFFLYYSGYCAHDAVLWTGIAAFTVVYHLWGRILMGCLTRLFPIRYDHFWFREWGYEKHLYKLLRVRRWKEKVLTYDPEAYNVKKHTLEELATTMSKSETDHWINELISLSTLLFGLIWGEMWIFLITALAAMIFDAQFIIVQRYNRPVVLRLIERRRAHAAPTA